MPGPTPSRRDRHRVILELVRSHRIASQEELREHLSRRGFRVTQATLSRDLKDLRVAKITGSDGLPRYALPEEGERAPALDRILPTLFVSAEGTGNLLVVKTRSGGAQPVALGIDREGWPEVLGTIAGDDTILVILREASGLEEVRRRMMRLARGES